LPPYWILICCFDFPLESAINEIIALLLTNQIAAILSCIGPIINLIIDVTLAAHGQFVSSLPCYDVVVCINHDWINNGKTLPNCLRAPCSKVGKLSVKIYPLVLVCVFMHVCLFQNFKEVNSYRSDKWDNISEETFPHLYTFN
jgi:hypothetical protein